MPWGLSPSRTDSCTEPARTPPSTVTSTARDSAPPARPPRRTARCWPALMLSSVGSADSPDGVITVTFAWTAASPGLLSSSWEFDPVVPDPARMRKLLDACAQVRVATREVARAAFDGLKPGGQGRRAGAGEAGDELRRVDAVIAGDEPLSCRVVEIDGSAEVGHLQSGRGGRAVGGTDRRRSGDDPGR